MRLKSLVSRLALVSAIALISTSCTQDEPKAEEVVKADKKDSKKSKHDFNVSKDGKVVFKAEIVYFKFDDHTLTSEGMARLDLLASYLKANPGKTLKIEGHCDERGSPEYNLALGQMRSSSVKAYLATVGIGDKRLDTVSFGEEKPAAAGRGEEHWSKNRRAEFTLTSAQSE